MALATRAACLCSVPNILSNNLLKAVNAAADYQSGDRWHATEAARPLAVEVGQDLDVGIEWSGASI